MRKGGWILGMYLAGCGRLSFDSARSVDAGDAGDVPLGDVLVGGDSPDAAPACRPGYRLCDGFEGPGFAPLWTVDPGVTIDTTVARARGMRGAR